MYYLVCSFIFSLGLITFTDNSVKNCVVKKYKQFREVNKLVETKYKNIFLILWISLNMIAKMYWMKFIHWANNSIEYIDHKRVIFSYVLNRKLYRFVINAKKGPHNILLITDEENNDVTDNVLPFYGASQDWHNIQYTPAFWNKKSLSFELASGEEKTFSEKEVIEKV